MLHISGTLFQAMPTVLLVVCARVPWVKRFRARAEDRSTLEPKCGAMGHERA